MINDAYENDEELVEQWLAVRMVSPNSIASYKASVNQFVEFADKSLPEITVKDMTNFLAFLQSQYKATTVGTKLGALRSLFTFGVDSGYLKKNIAKMVQRPLVKDHLAEKILTVEQIEQLVNAARRPKDKLLIRFAYSTGARPTEVISFRRLDLKARDEGGQVTIFGKYGLTRRLLLPEPLWSDLIEYCHKRQLQPEDKVFSTSRTSFWRLVKRTAIRAGMSWAASPHWLRHSHASHALENGAPLPLIRDALGHRNLMATTKYIHARPEDSPSSYLKKV